MNTTKIVLIAIAVLIGLSFLDTNALGYSVYAAGGVWLYMTDQREKARQAAKYKEV